MLLVENFYVQIVLCCYFRSLEFVRPPLCRPPLSSSGLICGLSFVHNSCIQISMRTFTSSILPSKGKGQGEHENKLSGVSDIRGSHSELKPKATIAIFFISCSSSFSYMPLVQIISLLHLQELSFFFFPATYRTFLFSSLSLPVTFLLFYFLVPILVH